METAQLQLALVRELINSFIYVSEQASCIDMHLSILYVPAQSEGLVMDGVTSHVAATAVAPQVVATGAGVTAALGAGVSTTIGAGVVAAGAKVSRGVGVDAALGTGVTGAPVGIGIAGTGFGRCVGAVLGFGVVGADVGTEVGAEVIAKH